MKVLLDTNVILDVLQNREPWVHDGVRIFRAAAANEITAYVTAKQIADIHFFARKLFSGQESVDEKARQVIGKLMSLFIIADTTADDCMNALSIGNGDYEDAILIACASREKMDCIITRNTEHFTGSHVPAVLPAEFMKER